MLGLKIGLKQKYQAFNGIQYGGYSYSEIFGQK